MENSLSQTQTHRLSAIQLALVIITGLGLIQSTVLGGLNFSIADVSLILLTLIMLSSSTAKLPIIELTFLALVFVSRTVISLILPAWLALINPEVFASILKMGLIIVYFVAGYLIGNRYQAVILLVRMFVIANLIIGIFGIVIIATNSMSLVPGLFISFRYKGLMNDPNYFSMLQIMSIPFVRLLWPNRSPLFKGTLIAGLVTAAVL